MAVKRKRKMRRKFLGSGSYGKGNAKNKRGKGGKGGWGNSGLHKHRYTFITAYDKHHFGVHGFAPVDRSIIPTVNLWEIEQMAQNGKLKQDGGKFVYEFEGKVLGSGFISKAVKITADSASEGAAEKIKKAGGELILREGKEEAAPAKEAKKE